MGKKASFVILDSKFRVIIPGDVRKNVLLEPGMSLKVSESKGRIIIERVGTNWTNEQRRFEKFFRKTLGMGVVKKE